MIHRTKKEVSGGGGQTRGTRDRSGATVGTRSKAPGDSKGERQSDGLRISSQVAPIAVLTSETASPKRRPGSEKQPISRRAERTSVLPGTGSSLPSLWTSTKKQAEALSLSPVLKIQFSQLEKLIALTDRASRISKEAKKLVREIVEVQGISDDLMDILSNDSLSEQDKEEIVALKSQVDSDLESAGNDFERSVISDSFQKTVRSIIAGAAKRKDDPGLMAFLCKTGSYALTADKFKELQDSFPHMDIRQSLLIARKWLIDNPSKRKTRKGINRFLLNWLSNDNDRGKFRFVR